MTISSSHTSFGWSQYLLDFIFSLWVFFHELTAENAKHNWHGLPSPSKKASAISRKKASWMNLFLCNAKCHDSCTFAEGLAFYESECMTVEFYNVSATFSILVKNKKGKHTHTVMMIVDTQSWNNQTTPQWYRHLPDSNTAIFVFHTACRFCSRNREEIGSEDVRCQILFSSLPDLNTTIFFVELTNAVLVWETEKR